MKIKKNDPILDIYNKISNSILTSSKEELNEGIWNIFFQFIRINISI